MIFFFLYIPHLTIKAIILFEPVRITYATKTLPPRQIKLEQLCHLIHSFGGEKKNNFLINTYAKLIAFISFLFLFYECFQISLFKQALKTIQQ